MGKKWTYCAVYSIIQIQFVRGIWEGIANAREDIYAVPGSDVNLTCQTQTKSFLVQMQWSKITDKVDLIALYHPQFGFHCGHRSPCESVVASIGTSGNVTKWTLHLRNISSLLSGKYECSFTLYPEGFQTKIYNLLLQTSVTQEEWRSNYTIEIEINQTLEIPCIQNISSEISSKFTFAWLVEDNGTQEALITKDHISSSTPFKDRVKLDVDGRLHLSPVHIHDDGKKFSCRLTVRTDKILRSSTTVKVFAKPEIPTIVENNTMEVLGEKIFTCSLKNVFPKANLTWLIDGRFLQGEEEGIYIANEERKGMSGFWELKSVLTRMHGNKPVISNNLTIWCMALSPIPGNKMWYTSSEKITFSLGSVNTTTDPQLSVTESTPGTQPFPANSVTPTRYPAVSSNTLTDVSASAQHTTPQTSNSRVTTQGFKDSWTSSGTEAIKSVSQVPSETHTSSTTDAISTFHDDVFTSTTREFSEVPTTANGATKNNHNHITSTVVNKPKDGMSWPVIIAVLLFFCLVLFGLGVRKWCQYQKEIMERPPPFKPPPPPIKYMCIQEPIGSDLPCHEMETL